MMERLRTYRYSRDGSFLAVQRERERGLFFSRDDGDTWTHIPRVITPNFNTGPIAGSPDGQTLVMANDIHRDFLYLSRDYGELLPAMRQPCIGFRHIPAIVHALMVFG